MMKHNQTEPTKLEAVPQNHSAISGSTTGAEEHSMQTGSSPAQPNWHLNDLFDGQNWPHFITISFMALFQFDQPVITTAKVLRFFPALVLLRLAVPKHQIERPKTAPKNTVPHKNKPKTMYSLVCDVCD